MLEALLYATMTASTPAQRAGLIASCHRYITNQAFCNLLQNIDINAPKKFNYNFFLAFDPVPGLREEINNWIMHGQKG